MRSTTWSFALRNLSTYRLDSLILNSFTGANFFRAISSTPSTECGSSKWLESFRRFFWIPLKVLTRLQNLHHYNHYPTPRLTWTEYQCTINLLDNDSFIMFENSAKPEEENAFGTGAEHETWNDVDPICWSAGRRDVVLERWKRTRWFLFTSICEKLDDPPSDATHHQTDRSQSETDEEL